jgi:hypothetical protein|uniref:Glycoside hydrolase family 5 domain-containing protein n=1 Tax=Bellilinea caldifistulae TaxID=360411 RepID=A0A7C4KZA6_9CHLR
MKRALQSGIVGFFLCLLIFPLQTIQAVRGVPGSPDFGYGAWIHPQSTLSIEGAQLLGELPLDWVAIPLDWAEAMPQISSSPELGALDAVFNALTGRGTVVMLRLYNPPGWAKTETGLNADITAQWLFWLYQRYQPRLRAVELLPAANTRQGWGNSPDPCQYANFFMEVKTALNSRGSDLLLIAGGLQPLNPASDREDWDDLDFLQDLYNCGAKTWMPVLSIQMPVLSGDPARPASGEDPFALRHYELVRQTMLNNDHAEGILWVTLINPPDGTIDIADQKYAQSVQQAEWLKQALIQMRSQLYMGVVFLSSLNPPPAGNPFGNQTALLTGRQSYHPFYSALQAVIQQTNPSATSNRPGRPKSIPIPKCQNKK